MPSSRLECRDRDAALAVHRVCQLAAGGKRRDAGSAGASRSGHRVGATRCCSRNSRDEARCFSDRSCEAKRSSVLRGGVANTSPATAATAPPASVPLSPGSSVTPAPGRQGGSPQTPAATGPVASEPPAPVATDSSGAQAVDSNRTPTAGTNRGGQPQPPVRFAAPPSAPRPSVAVAPPPPSPSTDPGFPDRIYTSGDPWRDRACADPALPAGTHGTKCGRNAPGGAGSRRGHDRRGRIGPAAQPRKPLPGALVAVRCQELAVPAGGTRTGSRSGSWMLILD